MVDQLYLSPLEVMPNVDVFHERVKKAEANI